MNSFGTGVHAIFVEVEGDHTTSALLHAICGIEAGMVHSEGGHM
jgi:hypothetical protein